MRNMIYGVAIAALLAIFAGIIFYWMSSQAPDTDRYGCLQTGELPAHTIVLIDQSDPFGANDIQWVEASLRETALSLPQYGRATILGLSEQPYTFNGQIGAEMPDARPLLDAETGEAIDPYSRCSPGNPDATDEATSNRRFTLFEWTNRFYEPSRRVARAIMVDRTAPKSPIVEAIETIAGRADFEPGQPGRRIVIISDGIQNSDAYSHIRSGTSWSAFQNTQLAENLPRLDGVILEIRFVPRPTSAIPRARIRDFWTRYARETGAAITIH